MTASPVHVLIARIAANCCAIAAVLINALPAYLVLAAVFVLLHGWAFWAEKRIARRKDIEDMTAVMEHLCAVLSTDDETTDRTKEPRR
ncbi:hypothetical protein [Streptomyces sp. NPDC053079]|uniref:hypothetical protein n=1 Tax=Streptomyces sp. NPDC053079 TaxID=3365697 RepID=UPI0037CD4A9F